MPLIVATDESVQGYGALVEHPDDIEIEIVLADRVAAVDEDSGDEAGWVKAHSTVNGKDVLFGRNDAVSGTMWAGRPPPRLLAPIGRRSVANGVVAPELPPAPDVVFRNESFVVPVALPGDDLAVEQVITFGVMAAGALYPGIWHDGIFPVSDHQRFLDRQGRVHARVSCDLASEFGHYLCVPLTAP